MELISLNEVHMAGIKVLTNFLLRWGAWENWSSRNMFWMIETVILSLGLSKTSFQGIQNFIFLYEKASVRVGFKNSDVSYTHPLF